MQKPTPIPSNLEHTDRNSLQSPAASSPIAIRRLPRASRTRSKTVPDARHRNDRPAFDSDRIPVDLLHVGLEADPLPERLHQFFCAAHVLSMAENRMGLVGLLQQPDLLVVQSHRRRRNGILQMLHLAGARQWEP